MRYCSHLSPKTLPGLLVADPAFLSSKSTTFPFHLCIFSFDTNQYPKHDFTKTLGFLTIFTEDIHSTFLQLPAEFHCKHKGKDFFPFSLSIFQLQVGAMIYRFLVLVFP